MPRSVRSAEPRVVRCRSGKTLQILSYSPRRSRALLELARLALGETRERRKTPELWSWKHGRNPFGRSQGLYAWDTEAARAIGLRMLMRWSFRRADASIVRALRAVDTATHPDWRRRGIFSTLTRRALEDARKEACFIFNTPNAASFAGYEKLGWKNVARFSIFRRTLVAPRSAASGEPWDVCFSRGVLPFSEFLERHARQARTIVRDWEEMRGCSGLRTPRSLAYLRWRYAGHPQIRYGVQALVVRGALLGWLVLRPRIESQKRKVMITEMFLKEKDLGLGRELVESAMVNLRAEHVLSHFASRSFEQRVLRTSSFARVPDRSTFFAVKKLRTTKPDPLLAKSWDLSLGDLEVF